PHHATRPLVARQPSPDALLHRLQGRRRAAARHHDGADRLAPSVIGHPDDRARGYSVNRTDRILDLGRINVLPAADDHVLLAVHQIEEPTLVESTYVTGTTPPVLQRR